MLEYSELNTKRSNEDGSVLEIKCGVYCNTFRLRETYDTVNQLIA